MNKNFSSLYPNIPGVAIMANRLNYAGGQKQQDRMIKGKLKSLEKALLYSYQAADITRNNDNIVCRALINPNKLKPDYDDKVLSTKFDNNFQAGDVFEWIGTKSYWIIYLQEKTELAYFRGNIRRCSYIIKWKNEQGEEKSTYAAVRGPVETDLKSIQKNGISVDTPNHSLHLLLPKNEETLNYFKRYSKFYLNMEKDPSSVICWRVEAIDSISTPGILEVNAEEYYANEIEDDIDKGIVGEKIPEKEETISEFIKGETFIKPHNIYQYEFIGSDLSEWFIDKKMPVKIIISEQNSNLVEIKWTANYSGQFNLMNGKYSKTIVVESLF